MATPPAPIEPQADVERPISAEPSANMEPPMSTEYTAPPPPEVPLVEAPPAAPASFASPAPPVPPAVGPYSVYDKSRGGFGRITFANSFLTIMLLVIFLTVAIDLGHHWQPAVFQFSQPRYLFRAVLLAEHHRTRGRTILARQRTRSVHRLPYDVVRRYCCTKLYNLWLAVYCHAHCSSGLCKHWLAERCTDQLRGASLPSS